MSAAWSAYISLQRKVIGPLVNRLFFEGKRSLGGAVKAGVDEGVGSHGNLVWFHAASAGELESLWTVIEGWLSQNGLAVVSILSRSAEERLEKLARSAEKHSGKLISTGYSPWEGFWREGLRRVKPRLFVTAKYEAWPELWSELGKQNIPLLIIGARSRRSFRIAANFMRSMRQSLPSLHLCTAIEDDNAGLKDLFPTARITQTGEPRWDRVRERAAQGSDRAKQLIEACQNLPRPWGILGSAWSDDLEKWRLAWPHMKGTVWVVPHDIGTEEIVAVEGYLAEGGLTPVRSSRLPQQQKALSNCVLVDEMGFLSELYCAADWAFVGGGFRKGVHSTIEPAIQGIPIAIGPKNADRFPEIQELQKSGQLRLLAMEGEIRDWLLETQKQGDAERANQRKAWRDSAQSRFGATDRVISEIRKAL